VKLGHFGFDKPFKLGGKFGHHGPFGRGMHRPGPSPFAHRPGGHFGHRPGGHFPPGNHFGHRFHGWG